MSSTEGYQTITTPNPPVIRVIDGALYIDVIVGAETFRAPIGDGRWFFGQVVTKLVDPALLAVQQVRDAHALAYRSQQQRLTADEVKDALADAKAAEAGDY